MQGSTNASTKKGHRNVEQASQVFVQLIGRVLKDFIAVSVVSCWPQLVDPLPRSQCCGIIPWDILCNSQSRCPLEYGLELLGTFRFTLYSLHSSVYGRFLDNSPAKENKNNLFDGACRVLMLDLICIQAGFFLAFFDFSKHLSNFPVFRKLTNANLRHVKEMKKRHVQKNLSL